MKFNWVNILAILLIVGGVCTWFLESVGPMVERGWQSHHTQHTLTVEEAKAAIQRKMETILSRPLSEPETDMFQVIPDKDNGKFVLVLQEPLKGRLQEKVRQARAATQPDSLAPPSVIPGQSLTPAFTGSAFQLTPAGAATAPSTGMP